jgi:hypothetical protein
MAHIERMKLQMLIEKLLASEVGDARAGGKNR